MRSQNRPGSPAPAPPQVNLEERANRARQLGHSLAGFAILRDEVAGAPGRATPSLLPRGRAAAGGRPLPAPLRARMERMLGHDFSQVRPIVGAHVRALGARAFVLGGQLHVAPEEFAPASAEGQRLLGHELAHVVQQRQGRSRAPAAGGLWLDSDPVLEREAESAGTRAMRGGKGAAGALDRTGPPQAGAAEGATGANVFQAAWGRRLAGAGRWLAEKGRRALNWIRGGVGGLAERWRRWRGGRGYEPVSQDDEVRVKRAPRRRRIELATSNLPPPVTNPEPRRDLPELRPQIAPPSFEELQRHREKNEKALRKRQTRASGSGESKKQETELTREEIAETTASALARQSEVSGHGRKPHGKYASSSSSHTLERNREKSQKAAVDKALTDRLERKKREEKK
jgi:hypothetical protein